MYILEIILSCLALTALIISITIKDRKKALNVQALNCFFEFIYNILISAITAASLSILNIIRTSIFSNKEKIKFKYYVLVLIIFEIIVIVNCIFTWSGYISLLPTIGTVFRTYALWQSNMKIVRVSGFTTGILYGLYYLYYGAYLIALGDLILIIVSIIAMYNNDIKTKNKLEMKHRIENENERIKNNKLKNETLVSELIEY